MASSARTAIVALAFALLTFATASSAQQQTGQFALYHGTPHLRSDLRLIGGNKLDIVQYPLRGSTPLTRYALTEGEALHVVLVRDDFRSFSHVHPRGGANGTFHVRVALDAGHRYYAFVGSKPFGEPWQVFRFTLQAGAPPHRVATTFEAPSTSAVGGPYRVTLTTAHLAAGKPQTIRARISTASGSSVATKPFRGAQAHTVFVNIQTLQYVHADAPKTSGDIALRVPPLTKGAYRMWLEFNDRKAIFAAPFTLVAE
jgi:hypothetical protein